MTLSPNKISHIWNVVVVFSYIYINNLRYDFLSADNKTSIDILIFNENWYSHGWVENMVRFSGLSIMEIRV